MDHGQAPKRSFVGRNQLDGHGKLPHAMHVRIGSGLGRGFLAVLL